MKTKPKDNNEGADGKAENSSVDIGQLLTQIGARQNDIKQIKLGHGLVGKRTSAHIATVAALAGIAIAIAAHNSQLGIAGALIIAGWIFWVSQRHSSDMKKIAEDHPDLALLEGAEVLIYRQQEIQLAGTKRFPNPPESDVVESDPSHCALLPPTGQSIAPLLEGPSKDKEEA
jgi:hypothetical protein